MICGCDVFIQLFYSVVGILSIDAACDDRYDDQREKK